MSTQKFSVIVSATLHEGLTLEETIALVRSAVRYSFERYWSPRFWRNEVHVQPEGESSALTFYAELWYREGKGFSYPLRATGYSETLTPQQHPKSASALRQIAEAMIDIALQFEMEQVMTPAEVEHEYNLKAGTVRQAVYRGALKSRRPDGRTILIHRMMAEAFYGDGISSQCNEEIAETPALSRAREVTISSSEWQQDDFDSELFWLMIQTNQTGALRFRTIGSYERELGVTRISKWAARYTVGNSVQLYELSTAPKMAAFQVCIRPGFTVQIGVLDDGLTALCGPLAFAKAYNLTNQPDEIDINIFEEAARIMATQSMEAAQMFVREQGYTPYLDTGLSGGPTPREAFEVCLPS